MKSLLIVDDDRVILNLLAEGLREAGYTVSAATSGPEALALAAGQRHDLAVLDMRMPDMSGLELARRLREQGHAHFVFLSAYGDEAVVRDAAEAGTLGYLVKPVDIPQLVPFIEAAISRGLEIERLRDTNERLEQTLKVEQATRTAVGIIMEKKGLDRREAFDLLRRRARAQRRKIGDVAEELIVAAENINLAMRTH